MLLLLLKKANKVHKTPNIKKNRQKSKPLRGCGRLYMVLVRDELFQIVANLVEKLFHGIAVAAFDNRL